VRSDAGSEFSFTGTSFFLLRQPARLSESLTFEDSTGASPSPASPAGLLHCARYPLPECDLRIFVPSAKSNRGPSAASGFERPEPDDWREEWDTITRRIYSDSARVVLKPLTGGFTSRTYRAESYDWDGRKQLPTVLRSDRWRLPSAKLRRTERVSRSSF